MECGIETERLIQSWIDERCYRIEPTLNLAMCHENAAPSVWVAQGRAQHHRGVRLDWVELRGLYPLYGSEPRRCITFEFEHSDIEVVRVTAALMRRRVQTGFRQ